MFLQSKKKNLQLNTKILHSSSYQIIHITLLQGVFLMAGEREKCKNPNHQKKQIHSQEHEAAKKCVVTLNLSPKQQVVKTSNHIYMYM